MTNDQLLSYIGNEELYRAVETLLNVAQVAVDRAQKNLYDNVVDPFSALVDAFHQGIALSQWLEQEKARKAQKTFQNAVGEFHVQILSSMSGWKEIQVADLINQERRIIAEVKNKYNTTKGNHKVRIYDDLDALLGGECKGFTGYYVEIIPKSPEPYNMPFTPPDNQTKTRRPANESIRVIDGKSFYGLASEDPQALEKLYSVLPKVMSDLLERGNDAAAAVADFMDLFNRAYVAH
jgi:hypothetical protein